MPLVIAPLGIVGVALASAIALLMYERLFGNPLEGLARSVPVVGGYIASGIAGAVEYGSKLLWDFLGTLVHRFVAWLDALSNAFGVPIAEITGFAHAVVAALDHLTHVTVHEIVKAFVNPVRDLAHQAEADATSALHGIDQLARDVEKELHGIEGSIEGKIGHLRDVIENVDLPNLQHYLEQGYHTADTVLGGEIDDVREWAGGWIDQLQKEFSSIPLTDLIGLLAAVPLLQTLVNTVTAESGLDRAECRRKVKGVCGTDPNGWTQLLGAVVPLLALPAIAELVAAGQELTEGLLGTVGALR